MKEQDTMPTGKQAADPGSVVGHPKHSRWTGQQKEFKHLPGKSHPFLVMWKVPPLPGHVNDLAKWKQFTRPEYALSLDKPFIGLLRWCTGKESSCQCRRCRKHRFDPWVGKISWRRNGNPFQYFCLESPMDRGTWWATVPGVAESDTTEHTHKPPTGCMRAIMWFNLSPSSVGSFSTCNEKRKLRPEKLGYLPKVTQLIHFRVEIQALDFDYRAFSTRKYFMQLSLQDHLFPPGWIIRTISPFCSITSGFF